jgi:PIF1-like helicase
MSVQEVELLDEKLRTLMRRHNSLYGGINVLFFGDFRQLEPVTGKPLYSTRHINKKWINSINCYVELLGLWRFQNDPRWGQILSRIQNDMYTSHDINAINKCTVTEKKTQGIEVPADVSYCVYSNADCSAINAGIFSNLLHAQWKELNSLPGSLIVIRASDMTRKPKSGKTVSMASKDRQYLYENCGDNRVQSKRRGGMGHFVDPVLKLYDNIPHSCLSLIMA